MNKTTKMIVAIASALAVIAAAVIVIVHYREQISAFIAGIKEKFEPKESFTNEEYEDFADI